MNAGLDTGDARDLAGVSKLELAAPAGLRPRLPIRSELRFGMNSGAASGADDAAAEALVVA
jgi:hypothetical protein